MGPYFLGDLYFSTLSHPALFIEMIATVLVLLGFYYEFCIKFAYGEHLFVRLHFSAAELMDGF